MTSIAAFTFNPFQENTYIVYDETNECAIVDPGCYEPHEKEELAKYVEQMKLKPVRLLNTHCHIDHVLGNKFVFDTWGLKPEMHRDELQVLEHSAPYGKMFGIFMEPSPEPGVFLDEGDEIRFGSTLLKIFFTPGHSPASLSFYCEETGFVLAGDVLFQQSIGRFDLPGGDFQTLIRSIEKKLFPLGDNVIVYPGHGPKTTIGDEKKYNPFLKGVRS